MPSNTEYPMKGVPFLNFAFPSTLKVTIITIYFLICVQKLLIQSCLLQQSRIQLVMRQSTRKFNIPPPRATSRAFGLFKIGLFKFPSLGIRQTLQKPKNSRAYYVRTRDKAGPNSPPLQGNVQIPPSPGTMHSQMPGVCPGGVLKF